MIKQLILIAFISGASILTGCASGYKEFYKASNGFDRQRIEQLRAAPAPASPIVERSRPGSFDETLNAYAKRGYIMIGNSMFNSGRNESEDAAIQQGKSVGADLVLIFDPNYTGSATSTVPITVPSTSTTYSNAMATAYGQNGQVTAYGSGASTTYGTTTSLIPITINRIDYGALYFFKSKFSLGAFFRDLNEAERQELQTNRGAVVRLVVDGTAAFDADLLIGDILTNIDSVPISNSQALGGVLNERKNKLIKLSLIRKGQLLEKTVQLNN